MIANWLIALSAVATAIVAVVAMLVQKRTSDAAREAQIRVTLEMIEQERRRMEEQRIWQRRAELYVRIIEAIRAHVERPTEGKPPEAAEETRLARLMAEADILASGDVRDLFAKFLYDNPSPEEEVDIWADIQSAARSELLGHSRE